jgi:hypothetical protein
MTTTEIATVPLLAGTSISDSDNTMLKETFALLHKVDGFQRFRFGIPLEPPENLHILIGKKEKTTTIPQNSALDHNARNFQWD